MQHDGAAGFDALLEALQSLPPPKREALLGSLPPALATRAREALVIPPVLGTLDTLISTERGPAANHEPKPDRHALLAQAFGLKPMVLERAKDHPDGLDGYERVGRLGKGGMGFVLEVRDPVLDRRVALKQVDGREVGAEAVMRFIEEARLTAKLQHPGIVSVHAIGRLDDDRLYYTMQRVRGRTLTEHIKALHGEGPKDLAAPTLHRIIGWFHSACEAMAYAHSRAVIHRDLKPDNIMIGAFGEVLVMDWGIAKPLGQVVPTDEDATLVDPEDLIQRRTLNEGSPLQTRTGDAVGTPMYMPPEQARGDLAALSPASDVFSLGAVLFQILSGRYPFEGDKPLAVMMQVILGKRRPLEGDLPIPTPLADICERAMARAPDDRFPDAAALARAVGDWLEGARKRVDALRLVREADGLVPTIAEHREAARRATRAAQARLEGLPAYAPVEDKRAAWAQADEAQASARAADQAEVLREEKLRAALSHVPDLPEAHGRLARLYQDRHAAAEAERDGAETIRYASLLRTHAGMLPATSPQREEYLAYLADEGRLSLLTEPGDAQVELLRCEVQDRRLVPTPVRALDERPISRLVLPSGSYVLRLSAPDRAPVRYPVRVERRRHWDGRRPGEGAERLVVLPAADAVGDGEVFVPAGPTWLGGDPLAVDGLPGRRAWVDDFVIQQDPVTNGAYLEFIHALVQAGRETDAIRFAPRIAAAAADHSYTWNTQLPVVMVDFECARAYAQWRSAQTGQAWRLPTEAEWEKAARGVDGRRFPWGDHHDPTWCRMRDSKPTERALVAVDAYPEDLSPYGVRGLGGNVREWTTGPFDAGAGADAPRVVRGGCYSDAEAGCRAASRFSAPLTARAQWLGFRLVRSLTPP